MVRQSVGQVSGTIDTVGQATGQASAAVTAVPKTEAKNQRSKAVRGAWAVAGLVSFGLGAVGAFVPLLPTTPFILLAAFCFARSSNRLNNWFHSTQLYKKVFEGYVSKREMPLKAKLCILIPVTILLGAGFLLMSKVLIGRIAVAIIWVCHVIYFGVIVRTAKKTEDQIERKQ